MPQGGGYSASNTATARLTAAARTVKGTLTLNPAIAKPSYCSGATYLVFLATLENLNNQAPITGQLAESLAIKGQPDGVGIWGRWNANGPGTACLFHELQLGENFTDWNAARPGDFMKIFWNLNVGRREHGHSAIYSRPVERKRRGLGQLLVEQPAERIWAKAGPENKDGLRNFFAVEVPGSASEKLCHFAGKEQLSGRARQ